MSETLDLDNMPLDELRRLANEELQQPRDEQGRFVSAQANPALPEQANDAPQDVDEVVYRRVIDLGDGGGQQVFEGSTTEELIENLAKAQEHATRKIREQAAALKAREEAAAVPKELSADEEFLLSQELLNNPSKVLAKLRADIRKELEPEFEPVRQLTAAQRDQQVAQEFRAAHPEFTPTEKDGYRIEKWLKLEGLQTTVENVEKAFKDLSESGLLEGRSENQNAVTTRSTAGERIAEPTTRIVGQRKVASGLSTRGNTGRATPQELTEEELYSMPMEKLRELSNAALRGNN